MDGMFPQHFISTLSVSVAFVASHYNYPIFAYLFFLCLSCLRLIFCKIFANVTCDKILICSRCSISHSFYCPNCCVALYQMWRISSARLCNENIKRVDIYIIYEYTTETVTNLNMPLPLRLLIDLARHCRYALLAPIVC